MIVSVRWILRIAQKANALSAIVYAIMPGSNKVQVEQGILSTDALNKIIATRQTRTVILDNAVRVFFATKVSNSFLVLYFSCNINLLIYS